MLPALPTPLSSLIPILLVPVLFSISLSVLPLCGNKRVIRISIRADFNCFRPRLIRPLRLERCVTQKGWRLSLFPTLKIGIIFVRIYSKFEKIRTVWTQRPPHFGPQKNRAVLFFSLPLLFFSWRILWRPASFKKNKTTAAGPPRKSFVPCHCRGFITICAIFLPLAFLFSLIFFTLNFFSQK